MDIVGDVVILLLFFVNMVHGKHCEFIYESGYMKYFFCNAYEYCCGAMCCRSQAVTFYQVWYFWLIVFLTLLLCSGGSWWYRFHNREAFVNPTMTNSPIATNARPILQPTGFTYGSSSGPQVFYPRPMTTQPQPMAQQTAPPPPYYEPPPTYEAATTKHGS